MVIFEIVFCAGVKQFYYGGALRFLTDKALSGANFYNMYLKYDNLEQKGKTILQNYKEQDKAELQIIDVNGNIIMSSAKFKHSEKIDISFKNKISVGEIHSWQGRLAVNNEEVLAVSTPLVEDGNIAGYLRFVSSLEEIKAAVNSLVIKALVLGSFILILSLLLAVLLSRSIIRPIRHLIYVSRKIAGGDFNTIAVKKYNDEIGELSDTINFMSEEIKKSNSLKNDFISSISHEIRTPLTAIRGWAEIINDNPIDCEETRQGIHIILKESKRLTKLVEELLDFSKFESGRIDMDFGKVDLNLLVKDVLKQYTLRFENKKVCLEANLDNRITYVNGDSDRLKQVLINIIDNALKFTGENGTVTVGTELTPDKVKICVTDNGIGIPSEDLPHITEKFFKGRSKQAGSGLGLSISSEIIMLHKGTIHIESEQGEGTKVTIELPIQEEDTSGT